RWPLSSTVSPPYLAAVHFVTRCFSRTSGGSSIASITATASILSPLSLLLLIVLSLSGALGARRRRLIVGLSLEQLARVPSAHRGQLRDLVRLALVHPSRRQQPHHHRVALALEDERSGLGRHAALMVATEAADL